MTMFSNRRNSQKPGEELYAAFKQSFPEVGPGTSSAGQGGSILSNQGSSTLDQPPADASIPRRQFETNDDDKEQDVTPKTYADWRLTPSLMDPNSFAFSTFANQPPGYYTPTPGGFNTLYHSQAGDLHTPGMGMNTPLSLPHSVHAVNAPDPNIHLQHFNPHLLHQQHPFHDHFVQQQNILQQQQQHQQSQGFAPVHFLQHHDSGYSAMDETPPKTTPIQNQAHMPPPKAAQPPQQSTINSHQFTNMPMGEKFRYHTTLNAPTAMIKQSDEIPVTYLNKGQAYTISIFDTTAPIPQSNIPLRYRTFVRISFEDEQQRARPGACWQLWKEGRGSNEAHQRGGKLLAVEYVDPNQGGDEDLRKSQLELENASFDGFSVFWYANTTPGVPDCSIPVRFNFLSTDFSHSKGVKGIPVRLCAKTELLTPENAIAEETEVCFSKVKLFRDHGAERKLSNDVAHVKKTIEKLKQQIAQAESGMAQGTKRKRSGSTAKSNLSKQGKAMKHKRTWSVDSDGETGRFSAEEDLHMKLASMQDMFLSTRPFSVLYLRGDPEDDPDLFPVSLQGDNAEANALLRTTTWESRVSNSDSPASNVVSLTPSSNSHTSPKRKYSEVQRSILDEEGSGDGEATSESSTRPLKIAKLEGDTISQNQFYVTDVDKNYKPPSEKPVRPLACFYVRAKDSTKVYYRAVYLMQRTVKDLVNGISQKFQIESHRVTQVTHVNSKGLHIVVDEDVVRELPEGQAMVVEFAPLQSEKSIKYEDDSLFGNAATIDSDLATNGMLVSDPLEMWLNY